MFHGPDAGATGVKFPSLACFSAVPMLHIEDGIDQ
jgi:hypothetical protein